MQVTPAIMFCTNIVALFIVPVLVWLTVSEDAPSYYVLALLLLWSYVLVTHIFKQVLSVNLFASSIMSLVYFIATYLVAFALGQLM